MTDTRAFKAISLFSGLGGDSLGMTQAGCNIIAYNELKPVFCKSHDANFPHSELICEGKLNDISKLKDETFVKYDGKTDIVFAGFPCQGFSNAGKKKEDDPRNTMFLEFLRVVLKKKIHISGILVFQNRLKPNLICCQLLVII